MTGHLEPSGPLAAEQEALVDAFVKAFERGDVPALVRLLAEDARFTMPPLRAWFDGRDDVAAFFAQRVFATPWRAHRLGSNGHPAIAGYQMVDGSFRLGAIIVLNIHNTRVGWIASFVDPDVVGQVRTAGPALTPPRSKILPSGR